MKRSSQDRRKGAVVSASGLVIGLALLAAGCGGSAPADESQPTGSGGGKSEVSAGSTSVLTMKDNVFVPVEATVGAPKVKLINEGETLHNLSVEGESVDFDVQPGETETEALRLSPGSYTMFCKYHRKQGMEGTLTIE